MKITGKEVLIIQFEVAWNLPPVFLEEIGKITKNLRKNIRSSSRYLNVEPPKYTARVLPLDRDRGAGRTASWTVYITPFIINRSWNKVKVFRDVTPSRLANSYRGFEDISFLGSTVVTMYQTIRGYIPKDSKLQRYRCKNLKSRARRKIWITHIVRMFLQSSSSLVVLFIFGTEKWVPLISSSS